MVTNEKLKYAVKDISLDVARGHVKHASSRIAALSSSTSSSSIIRPPRSSVVPSHGNGDKAQQQSGETMDKRRTSEARPSKKTKYVKMNKMTDEVFSSLVLRNGKSYRQPFRKAPRADDRDDADCDDNNDFYVRHTKT